MTFISPKVDIAFKKIFGVEENKDLLISLINSIICEEYQATEVTILNPYNAQNFKENKLSILDIKTRGITQNGSILKSKSMMRLIMISERFIIAALKKVRNVLEFMNFGPEERDAYEDHFKFLWVTGSALKKKADDEKEDIAKAMFLEGIDSDTIVRIKKLPPEVVGGTLLTKKIAFQ